MRNFGYIPSKITASTVRFKAPKTKSLPTKYSLRLLLPQVEDQGEKPYCIPYSIGTWLNWKYNIKHSGGVTNNHIRYEDIYGSKKSVGNGMTYVEAFNYLKTKGVRTDRGIMKITEPAIITSVDLIKVAIIANGPVFASLPVYDVNSSRFWEKTGDAVGWHSIAIVGWDENGYIIRNSWGRSFGDDGYTHLPYDDENKFHEIWTIM